MRHKHHYKLVERGEDSDGRYYIFACGCGDKHTIDWSFLWGGKLFS